MKKLVQLSVQYPVTVFMVFTGIVLLGIISWERLPINLFPDIRYPRITIVTETAGMAPEEVERRISEPLERLMAGIKNVEQVSSISRADQSVVMVDFAWGTNMDFAMLDVKKASGDLREEYDSMNVLRFDPNARPILTLGLTGGENPIELRRLAEKTMKPYLERVPGVAEAEVAGGLAPEIRIQIDSHLLAVYNLTLNQVTQAVQNANVNATGGLIEDANRNYIVRAVGEFKNLEDVRRVVAGYSGSRPIVLDDIALVERMPAIEKNFVRVGGEPGVGINLYKEPDSNTVLVVRDVRQAVEDFKENLPEDITVSEVYDQSRFISSAISEVQKSAMYGILLAVFVLFYFLRNIRSTLIIAVAIPVSIVATFNLMYFGGLSLNIMTLGGLALGAGMLVDNAIVVLENIFRRRQEGLSPSDAAVEGCSEVSTAIVSSTLTTCVVFLPIIYLRGVTGLLFREQALTVVFALLTSLWVALSFIPMLSSRFLKAGKSTHKRKWYNPLRWMGFLLYNDRLQDAYQPVLAWSLRRRLVIMLLTAGVVYGGVLMFQNLKQELIPKSDQPQFVIDISMPVGTNLSVTDQATGRIEGKLIELGDQIKSFYSEIGIPEESSRNAQEIVRGSHTARILVTLNTEKKPTPSALQIIKKLQEEARRIYSADVQYDLYSNSAEGFFGSDNAPMVIEVKGPNLTRLKESAQEIIGQLEETNGLTNLRTNLLSGSPQVNIIPDRDQLADLGLTVQHLGEQIRTHLAGQAASTMKSSGEDEEIIVEVGQAGEDTLDGLRELWIEAGSNRFVKLGNLAQILVEPGPLEILRRDSERRAVVEADLEGIKLSDAVALVREKLHNLYLPRGYQLRIGGEEERRLASFERLRFSLILAVILVYMVMASLFESLLHPLVVMFSAPLAVTGVAAALMISNTTLNLMAYIGIVMLVGIVVNNAIVLIDCVNRLRSEGASRNEALIQAGRLRLRPILMTTATTIIALMPLAVGLGEGSELRAPMATAVIGGLVSSTILTLFFIPVLYSLVDQISSGLRQLVRPGSKQATSLAGEEKGS